MMKPGQTELMANERLVMAAAPAALLIFPDASAAEKAADTVLADGKIVTFDSWEQVAKAMAIRDGRIVAVGMSADTLKPGGDHHEVIRLGGKTVFQRRP
jgi:adenine deaminase